jgi:pimeloyl-ACP methyl ester carboxylesterase
MFETLKIVSAVVVIGILLLYVFQDALIFFPPPVPPPNRAALAEYAVSFDHDGHQLQGWYIPGTIRRERPLLVYYGGNAEEVSGSLLDRPRLKAGAYLFINYRGYGDSGGKPSQNALCRDALFILDTMTARENIPWAHVVLMGRSLGSGVAVYVASRRPVGGVILVTPYDSLVRVARRHYPFLPVGLLLKHPFDSAALAPDITAPALVITAGLDEIIPAACSARLARLWGGPVQTVVIDGHGHNDLQLDDTYWDAINDFLAGPRPTEKQTARAAGAGVTNP